LKTGNAEKKERVAGEGEQNKWSSEVLVSKKAAAVVEKNEKKKEKKEKSKKKVEHIAIAVKIDDNARTQHEKTKKENNNVNLSDGKEFPALGEL
jgi:SLT domain-containing protein